MAPPPKAVVGAAAAAAGGVAAWALWASRRRRRRDASEGASQGEGGEMVVLGDAFVDVLVCGLEALPRWNADVLAGAPICMQAGGSALNTAVHLAGLAPARVSLHAAAGTATQSWRTPRASPT